MSTYLSRLATRGCPTGGAVALKPFIRSRSPIADRDQRIGVAGMEGVGSNLSSSLDEAHTEPAPPPGAMYEPLPQAGTAAGDGSGEVILRRKPDSAVPMAAALSVPAAVTHSTPGEMHHSTSPQASSAGIGDRRPDTLMREPVALPERAVAPNLELSPVATDGIRSQDTIPSDSEADARSHPVSPVVVRKRSVHVTRQVDTAPRLEPSPRSFPDPIERSLAEPGRDRADADAGPRVAVDHVNVEVVPPPVATETRAPSRPGPLTAASVSVIGPLSGNLSSRLAFGLRYR